jgi:23S rRNA (cytosine1962-C5)-methyltransferase
VFDLEQYELIDFGGGRKLERFGSLLLDRPSPAAEGTPKANPALWGETHARYERLDDTRGRWTDRVLLPATWTIRYEAHSFELRPTDFGHVGLFPEQAANWDWIAERIAREAQPCKILNLFAYTGGSTLAAAAAGAEVVHIDAAKNVVAWARRNAELSGLADRPIRWIAEDAMRFVLREIKRRNQYDAVILDPPSYGHGPRGEPWKLADDLPALLSACGELTARRRTFILLSCHTPGYGVAELSRLVKTHFGRGRIGCVELHLTDRAGRRLDCGACVRYTEP